MQNRKQGSVDRTVDTFLGEGGGPAGSFKRAKDQSNKCRFGSSGVCCRICANGPCRITAKSPRGVCGASADTMVSRNFLRSVSVGAGCYLHVAENSARMLCEGEQDLNQNAVDQLADRLGIDDHPADPRQTARAIGGAVLEDLYAPRRKKCYSSSDSHL